MERLQIISQINPVWAVTISSFIEMYPEFKEYQFLAPIHQVETCPYPNINTLFHAIMFYICSSGVRYTYAKNQWEIIYPLLDTDDWTTIMEASLSLRNNPKIQNKKRETYFKLCHFMNENGLTHTELNISHLDLLRENVSGIGDGCVAWCKKYFTIDDDCVEYTDITFKKGFKKVYNKDSLSSRKQKAKEWQQNGFGRIGSLMIIQIGGYA